MPTLLTRMGERLALREIDGPTRAAMIPLFAAHPVAVDPDTQLPKSTVEAHLSKLLAPLAKDWGAGAAFMDLRHVNTNAPMSDGTHAVDWFGRRAAQLGADFSPAISPSAHNVTYRASAIAFANVTNRSILLRLGPGDWPSLGTPLGDGALAALIRETGRGVDGLHLMLDLEDQVSANPAIVAIALRQALAALPSLQDWRSITISGTGMPTGTAAIGADSSADIARSEWDLWRLLQSSAPRRTTFGDYAVQHPDPNSDFDPRYMDSSAQLRYTTANSWFVVRGRGVRRTGTKQIHALAAQVVNEGRFSGAGFSWGDHWLTHCAARTCKPGTQGVWRKVTTNHHLTFVVRQLASPGGP